MLISSDPLRALATTATAAAFACALAFPSLAQSTRTRTVANIDTGWTYTESDPISPRDLDALPPSAWQRVDLPHTWNRFDPTDATPGYRRAASWYRRTLDLRRTPASVRSVLHFECANTVADVYVNGRRAGGHVGGYVGFDVDITRFVRRDGRDQIAVRVDNSDAVDLIPSDKSDFVIYGGLTRDVWLETRPSVAIAHVSTATPHVSHDSASTSVTVRVANHEPRAGDVDVDAAIIAPSGTIVGKATAHLALRDTLATVRISLPSIAHPSLWSPASPALYTVRISLARAGATLDRVEDSFGYRWYSFEPNGPFLLNGERLLLRGTHRHEEMAGYGSAMPNALHRADMAQIKAMGANFVRLAHYPQDPEIYRAADSLGLLLWDELPWDRAGLGGATWQANTRRLLAEQIDQNINHPSIILWSLGNEVADVIDPAYDGSTPAIARFMSSLDTLAHTLDPFRPTATRKFDAGFRSVDVYSPSIWQGWYGGVYRNYEASITAAHAKFPRFFHAEYGADAHYGRHSEHPITGEGLKIDTGSAEKVGQRVNNVARDGDWSESYQTDLLEWHLQVAERTPWLTGNAQWAFRDFATPLRPENPIPYVNEKGLFTRDGQPKDAWYLFRSYWTADPKFAYIVSHTWTARSGPPGAEREVRVFSNCSSVALSVNGHALGARVRDRTSFPAQGLRWNVAFAEGDNRIAALCAGADEATVADSLTVHYTHELPGKVDHIALAARDLDNGHVLVDATIVDAAGRRVLSSADRLYFSLEGNGALLADYGSPTGSSIIEAANGRAAIEVVRPEPGRHATIIVRTQDINGSRIVLDGPAPAMRKQ
jgi:beta-galactosidase